MAVDTKLTIKGSHGSRAKEEVTIEWTGQVAVIKRFNGAGRRLILHQSHSPLLWYSIFIICSK